MNSIIISSWSGVQTTVRPRLLIALCSTSHASWTRPTFMNSRARRSAFLG